jgi:hypothetical protein
MCSGPAVLDDEGRERVLRRVPAADRGHHLQVGAQLVPVRARQRTYPRRCVDEAVARGREAIPRVVPEQVIGGAVVVEPAHLLMARAASCAEPRGNGPVCKPDPVVTLPLDNATGDHPSTATVASRLQRPTRELGRAALERSRRSRSPATLLALLHVGFTEPPQSPAELVVSYTTVSPLPALRSLLTGAAGGLFSVALSRGSPRVGVTHHAALWSPDFPRRTPVARRTTRSPDRPVHTQG